MSGDEPRGLNILCIDGGGARGLSSLIVLREVMNRLEDLQSDGVRLNPADYFDVIAGSGTGGLSACMLGRLRMPLDSAIEEYAKLIQEVFADKKIIRTSGPSAYKGTKLREALERMVNKFGKGGEMMEEGDVEGCKTIVFAMSKHNMNAGLPTMFRSYPVGANRGPNCTILDTLHTTMAHHNLFKDIEIGEGALRQSFISGDLGCSNPMAHVLTEVKRVYPGRHVSCILSIGAGHARTISIPDYSLPEQVFRTQDLAAMKDMATDSERVAEEMAIRFGATSGVYFRFNVDQGTQDMKAGDWERLQSVMAHTKAYLLKIDTDRRMIDVVQAIKKQNNLLEVELIDGQVQQRSQVRRGPRMRKCPAPTPVYTGRKDEAKQVIECILENGDERSVCVIYGLGGSGKTQLALKVVEQTRNKWVDILYIDGTSRGTIETALKAFAGVKNIGCTYQDAIDWLESCLERWLMVFDNVDEPSVGVDLRHYVPGGTYGSVLITTRLADLAFLARGTGSVCRMSPGMKPEESLVLLLKVARLPSQHLPEVEMEAAVALMEDFGYLALAIVHAGAYIGHSPGLTISNYRKLFLSQRRRMLDEYNKLKVPVDDYTKTVYTTWEMCYSLLKQDTRRMLWLIAFLHHNAITEEIFKRAAINTQSPLARVPLLPPSETVTSAFSHVEGYLRQFLDPAGEWDRLLFLSIINEVVSYSLIDFDRMNDAYSIHVLVQDWAKTKVEQRPELALESATTLLSLSIGFDDSPESKDFMVSLEMHLDRFLTNKQSPTRDYHRQFTKVYRELKRWQQVEDLEINVYQEMNRTLGEKHMYTLGSMIDLASTYVTLDRLDKAEELQMRALNIQKESLGRDHPHTQRSITNLASIYLKQGRLDEAEKVQLQGFNSNAQLQPQKFSGPSQEVTRFQSWDTSQQGLMSEREFLNTLRGKANLASVYCNRGRLVEAEALQNEVLNVYRGKFTEEHSDTVASMLNLLSTYCLQNRWDESARLCLRVVELQTKMLGETDSNTVKSMAKLVMIYSKQGQWAEAEVFQQHVISSYEQTLGSTHLDVTKAISELAVIYSKQDDWAGAKILQEYVVKSYQQNLGLKHIDTLKATAGLAVIYSKQDNWSKAEALQRGVVHAYKQMFGPRNPDTLGAMAELAMVYSKQGRWDESKSLQVHVLRLYEGVPHTAHRDIIMNKAGLIVTYSKRGEWEKVATLLKETRRHCEGILDKQNPGVQATFVKYGILHLYRGHLAQEVEVQERILGLYAQLFGQYNLGAEFGIETLTATLSYLEAYAWLLNNSKLSRLGLLIFLLPALWLCFAYQQLGGPESLDWFEYYEMLLVVCSVGILCIKITLHYATGAPILCDVLKQQDGKVRISTGWMPRSMSGNRQAASSYSSPIGTIRLWIKCAKDVKNVKATLGGKSDPYVRVMLNAVTMARTEVKNSNLNPEWDQIVYVPVHSLRETLYLECMDYQRRAKDRSLGFVELSVAGLARQTDDERVPYEGTGKRDVVDPIRLGEGQVKGELHYTAEFIPVLALQGINFEGVDDIQRAVDHAKGAHEDEDGFAAIGVLQVTIFDARGLKGAKIGGGTPNPYVSLTINNRAEMARTKFRRSTYNPHWGEVKFLVINSLTETLNLRLLDHSSYRKDTKLGIASFQLSTLAEDATQEGLIRKVLKDGRERGEIKFDASFFPVLKPQALDGGKIQPLPETKVGFVRLVIHQAKELDASESTSGDLNPFAKLLIRNREIHKTNVMKHTLGPVWESPKEFLVTDKASTVVIDDRDFLKDPVVGYMNIRLKDLLAAREKQQDWFPLSGCKSGKVRISADWKPLNMAGCMQGAGSYSPPIGIIRLWIKCAKDVKNVKATLGGKSDPYVRVMLNAVTMARTEVKNNNLNPEWDQIVYVPVHSLRETLYLECMDYQHLTKDRSLGFAELSVAGLARQTDDERVPYEGTGKRDVADPIRLGKGQVKGELHYTAEFIPGLALQDINFEGIDDIQRAIDRAKGAHKDEDGFASADESSVSSSDEEIQRVPMDITVNSKGHLVSNRKHFKSADTVRTAQTGQTAATDTEESELDDETPPEEHKGEGVKMTTEELLSQQSGILVFNIMEGHIAKKARLEVLLDDGYWPVFATEKARSTQAHWDQVGEGFIKELDFGRVWLRLNENDEGEKEDIIAEFKLDAKQFLEEALAGPAQFTLTGPDGKNTSTVRIQAKYVPVEIKLDPRESINNMGVLHVELVDGREIVGADRSGKSDPFVVFSLNGSKVYKSQTKKKTLTPEWKESFDVSVPSRVGADFSLEVFDWNQVEAAKSLGSGQIELADVVPFEVTARQVALNSAKHGEKGIIQIRMVFSLEIVAKSRTKTSIFSTAGRAVTQVGGVPLGAGRAVGRKIGGLFGRDKDSSEELPEVPVLAPVTEPVPATNGNGAANGSVGSASGAAVEPPASPAPGPGTLKVTLYRAKDLTGVEEGDVAKPYVIMRIGDKDHKSSHVKSNTPEWNESFTFPNTSTEIRTLHVAIMDKKTFAKDPILAKGTIDIWQHILPLFTPPILSKEATIQLNDNSGTLQLRLDFEPMQNT